MTTSKSKPMGSSCFSLSAPWESPWRTLLLLPARPSRPLGADRRHAEDSEQTQRCESPPTIPSLSTVTVCTGGCTILGQKIVLQNQYKLCASQTRFRLKPSSSRRDALSAGSAAYSFRQICVDQAATSAGGQCSQLDATGRARR